MHVCNLPEDLFYLEFHQNGFRIYELIIQNLPKQHSSGIYILNSKSVSRLTEF